MITYKTLGKSDYLSYNETLIGKDRKFSKVAIGMWNFMKAWEKWPVRVLEQDGKIISVCFMKLSKQADSKVLFISNIFTPTEGRGKGSASLMLDYNIKEAVEMGATSIRLDCNKSALGFYDKLGFTYWGVTKGRSMFCDLPINEKGIECFQETKDQTAQEILYSYSPKLILAKIKWIKRKIKAHKELDFGHISRYNEFVEMTTSASITI
jgi:hypothetical protein